MVHEWYGMDYCSRCTICHESRQQSMQKTTINHMPFKCTDLGGGYQQVTHPKRGN